MAVNTNTNVNAETAGTPTAASAESQAAAATALVTDLYKQHDAKKSPFFQTKDRALVDKYFTKTLADLIWKDANNSSGEVGAIDGDPLYNAQDMEIKGFAVGKAEVKGDDGKLAVTFTNFGEKKTINIPFDEAYGPVNPEMIIDMPKERFPAEMELEVGMPLMMSDGQGHQFQVTITEIKEVSVMLDANHPLAGKDLIFDLELVEIEGNSPLIIMP